MSESNLEILDFYADWCGPCRVMKPILEELEQTYAGKITFTKIDVDKESDRAQEYNVLSIPTLIFKKGGKIVDQIVGSLSKDELVRKIDEHS